MLNISTRWNQRKKQWRPQPSVSKPAYLFDGIFWERNSALDAWRDGVHFDSSVNSLIFKFIFLKITILGKKCEGPYGKSIIKSHKKHCNTLCFFCSFTFRHCYGRIQTRKKIVACSKILPN